MFPTFTGACYLTCNAYLENPRFFYESQPFHYIIVDCSFPTVQSMMGENYTVASLVIRTCNSHHSFVPGLFAIHAKVIFSC